MTHGAAPIADPTQYPTQQHLVLTALHRNLRGEVLIDDDGSWTGRELRDTVARLARTLTRHGLGPGSRVALLGANSAHFVVAQLSCVVAGAAYSGMYLTAPADELKAALTQLHADALVFDPRSSGEVVRSLAGDPALAGCSLLSLGPHPDAVDVWAEAADEEPTLAPAVVAPTDPASISWTGGTTGRSKGVLRSQRAIACMNTLMLAEWDWPRDVRYVVVGPLSHAAGSIVPSVLMRGGTVIVRPRFDVEDLLASIATHRATVAFLVPTMLYRLLDHLRSHDADTSTLELVIYGASPVSPARLNEAIHRLGPIFMQLYGQVEAPNCIATFHTRDHTPDDLDRLAACGHPMLGNDVVLLDDDDQPVATGEVGQVCVRGPLVMDGYLDDPEATAEALRGGWLHTGDLGTFDADGLLYLVDRAKDMIVTGGFNVYPREVEDVLATHPSVAAAAVIGVPDPEWGEAVAAYVVAAPGATIDTEELRALVRARKGGVHTPKAVHVVDALPVTAVGKPDKKALRARHWGEGRAIN